ncbi:ATP-NAD kinase-like domain-containing protein, partial [Mycena latifolia]
MYAIRSYCSSRWPFNTGAARCERASSVQWDTDTDRARLSDEQELVIFHAGNRITLTLLDTGIRVATSRPAPKDSQIYNNRFSSGGPFSRNTATHVEIVSFLHVLMAGASLTLDGRSLFNFSYLSAATNTLQLRQISYDMPSIEATAILKWASDVKARAYKGITPQRRFLVVVNPHGGRGKAERLWKKTVEPIFAAAGCSVDVLYTGLAGSPTNAAVISRNVDLAEYDALVAVSGDGISNELINGLASRPDALSALRMPIAPIPAGSGNALSVNVLGPDKVVDVAYAALNAIKGKPMPLDICSVTQGDTRMYSFLSFGIMADLDMGTEWMRWVGDIRFVLGYLYGTFSGANYDVEITLKIVESDKHVMADSYNRHQQARAPAAHCSPASHEFSLPLLAFGTTDAPLPCGAVHDRLEAPVTPGWHTFRTPVRSICAGRLPWLARDSMMFPLATDDGLLDVVIFPPLSVSASLKSIAGQAEGRFIRLPHAYYFKVEMYRCTPLEPSGYISIDGESIPHKVFQVENHPGLARIMNI